MAARERFGAVQPWLSLVVRLGMAGILIAAALPKLVDIPQSIRAVRAYRLLPEAVVPFTGTMLPFVELALALLLLVGAFTRLASIVWLVMMAAFLTGVIWAWATGLTIDCGCFGGGGEVAEGETNYPVHLLERLGFIALGTYLAIWPRSRFSVDGWLAPQPLPQPAP
ncbi:MauE/DoxX family redox-associated membrane protein [Demequina muriae]|uniref:MauE/DoxX family redox-associated membrane protein n=1 Tax=Demequina muriae TaxID=3051664 RepID=A0ABT8GFR9_9MICO|nr:MauE/DoxX family redox-associated membrane protein [Demequina sp. EGI L300058]MDN4480126.1 MauE/DoxX family redox-associated membrane protein [Demequina sp. EGI L300058]